jgi:hypothetical protein
MIDVRLFARDGGFTHDDFLTGWAFGSS